MTDHPGNDRVDDYEAVRALYEEPGMLRLYALLFPAEEPEAYFESYVKNMYWFYDFGMYVLEDARTRGGSSGMSDWAWRTERKATEAGQHKQKNPAGTIPEAVTGGNRKRRQ